MRGPLATAAVVVGSLLQPALASAGTASVGHGGHFSEEAIRFTGGDGEHNLVEIRRETPTADGIAAWLVIDRSVPVRAGRGCLLLDAHTARCDGSAAFVIEVRLRDGDDRLVVTNTDLLTSVDAGEGDDQVALGDTDDHVIGGPGDDALDGGGGADVVSYVGHRSGVRVDLRSGRAGGQGESDRLRGFEGIDGSGANDRLAGDDGGNTINGRGGRDRLLGRRGDDVFRAPWSGASGSVRCGRGRDTVDEDGDARALLGRDCELIETRLGRLEVHPDRRFRYQMRCPYDENDFSTRCRGRLRVLQPVTRRLLATATFAPTGGPGRLQMTALGALLARRAGGTPALMSVRYRGDADAAKWRIRLGG